MKLTQYADDTTLLLDGSRESLSYSIELLNNFGNVSGLVVNYSKSSILRIGSIKNYDTIFFPNKKLIWSKGPIKFLGIHMSLNRNEMSDLNYEVQLKKISTILNVWSQRGITPIGKVTVIKSLAISQLTYLLSVLPNPPDNYFKKIEKIFLNFIWSGKPDKIKRQTMFSKIEEGGLNMTDIFLFKDAIKIAWVKRYNDPCNEGKWKLLFAKEILKIGGDWIWQCEPQYISDLNMNKVKNAFLKDILRSWFRLRDKNEVSNKVLWYNKKNWYQS